jgi:hypothetical protein
MMFDAMRLTDDALKAYDLMMIECFLKIENPASLAISIWSEVLKELDQRRLVTLLAGSYDDPGNANIARSA